MTTPTALDLKAAKIEGVRLGAKLVIALLTFREGTFGSGRTSCQTDAARQAEADAVRLIAEIMK